MRMEREPRGRHTGANHMILPAFGESQDCRLGLVEASQILHQQGAPLELSVSHWSVCAIFVSLRGHNGRSGGYSAVAEPITVPLWYEPFSVVARPSGTVTTSGLLKC